MTTKHFPVAAEAGIQKEFNTTSHLRIETGYRVLINSAWFLTLAFHYDETVTIIEYDRDHIAIDKDMRQAKPIEDDQRIITHVEFDGATYKVRNPAHVFSYYGF